MAIDQKKFEHKHESMLRDVRPLFTRIGDGLSQPMTSSIVFLGAAMFIYINDWGITFADLILVFMFIFWVWLFSRDRALAFKLPMGAGFPDPHNGRNGKKGKAEGILYLGNVDKSNEEVWFTNSDIRTHILYLGTTGAGKTEGLKSLVTNAMAWGSGFVYVDGKADTDLWSSLSSLVRRFGRDDDLLVLNYMTGNANIQAPSNTMNPFSSGSASYLTNMLVSLMPESGGDNAMWKERAVSLVGAMMPILTWKRDHQEVPMSVRTIREYLTLANVIKLSRDEAVPREVRIGLIGYLDTLPGFIGAAYDDNGQVKPPGPDTPQYNTETASQQHGYLAMQFTRSLQSLGDDYGYIFDTQAADVDMVDVVLNRRILVVLVPALEKSGDEVANLGKIVAASIKGMMGSTLGSTVEGSSETVIENKPTHSATPFMTVFDEVGYYVAEGMAVMAAQARSLGFSLVFAGQDLPAMKKRVREEANSITANCNIKLFGKLEDPTETKDFFEKTVGSAMVTEVSGFQMTGGTEMRTYYDSRQASVQLRPRAQYDRLRGFKEGMAIITYGETVVDCQVFYSNPGFAKAMRVTRFMSLPPPDDTILKHASAITKLRDLMVNKTWTATRADAAVETPPEIAAMSDGFVAARRGMNVDPVDAGIAALVKIHAIDSEVPRSEPIKSTVTSADDGSSGTGSSGGGGIVASPPIASPLAQKPAETSSPLAAVRPADIAAQQTQPPIQPSGAKPSIFGGKPSATPETPTASIPQPVSTPASEAPVTPSPAQQTSAAAKPSIFGGGSTAPAQPVTPQATETSVQAQPMAAPQENASSSETQATQAKPAIFGAAKPMQTVSEVQTVPQQTQISEQHTALPETQEETSVAPASQPQMPAKPSIFGGSKPVTPTAPVPTETVPPAQEQSLPPEQPVDVTPVATPAEPAPQQEQPPVQTEAANPAKPSIFQKKPTEPPPGDDTGQQG